MDTLSKAWMVVRGTSIVDVRGVADCGNACEDRGREEVKHACKREESFTLRLRSISMASILGASGCISLFFPFFPFYPLYHPFVFTLFLCLGSGSTEPTPSPLFPDK